MSNQLTYPRFYFQRGQLSDRDWILARMAVIPDFRKHEVSLEYERLYMGDNRALRNRKAANTYLHAVAREYRQSAVQNPK